MLKTAPDRNKILYMQVGSFLKYIVFSVAAFLSGWVTKNVTGAVLFGGTFTGYEIIFVLSFAVLASSFVLVMASRELMKEQPAH
jgi:H+/Cl- antiporter ClcA